MSEIDFSRLRSVTARELTRALRRDGFDMERQTGSHQQYYHEDGRRVTVTFHRPGNTFSVRLLRIMIEVQAGWTEADLRRLDLL
tara:strand:+ start:742 stop:993 length:252 start_codon:yes stop_codon:yes gene_type:complete